jgi:hypothetical protein
MRIFTWAHIFTYENETEKYIGYLWRWDGESGCARFLEEPACFFEITLTHTSGDLKGAEWEQKADLAEQIHLTNRPYVFCMCKCTFLSSLCVVSSGGQANSRLRCISLVYTGIYTS